MPFGRAVNPGSRPNCCRNLLDEKYRTSNSGREHDDVRAARYAVRWTALVAALGRKTGRRRRLGPDARHSPPACGFAGTIGARHQSRASTLAFFAAVAWRQGTGTTHLQRRAWPGCGAHRGPGACGACPRGPACLRECPQGAYRDTRPFHARRRCLSGAPKGRATSSAAGPRGRAAQGIR